MRIVVVTTSYPRTDDDPAGHFVRSAARGLARAGHEVHVIAPGGSLLDPPRLRGGVVVHRAGGGALFAWPGAIARAREAPLTVKQKQKVGSYDLRVWLMMLMDQRGATTRPG